jgi:putative PIN family toxin of toxin-antitoxin system
VKKAVLDTNVLLVSVSDKSRLHWVFQKLIIGDYTLCVSNEILNEYAEILDRHMGSIVSESVLGVIENLENVEFITSYFQFHLLADEDDDKFVDCAIAANADFIVSHDKDFKVLQNIDFPKVSVIDTEEFAKRFDD